jgi:hypothetical protein
LARIGGKHRRRPKYYAWLRVGRLVTISRVLGRTRGGHVLYEIASKRAGPYEVPSYDLRHPNERLRAVSASVAGKRSKGELSG